MKSENRKHSRAQEKDSNDNQIKFETALENKKILSLKHEAPSSGKGTLLTRKQNLDLEENNHKKRANFQVNY